MKAINASDCGSRGALLMSWFHQLSAGKSRRPLKSSFNVTAEVVGVGDGDGDGVGAGAGIGDGDGEVVAVGVGLAGVDIFLLQAIAIARQTPSATQHTVRRIIEPRIREVTQL
jgi:hypothetical protein